MLSLPVTVRDPKALELPPKPVYLALGMFDGVHLGHLAVIEAAINSARQCAGIAAVMTFDPHPSHLFNPQNPTRLIMPVREKEALLREHGVDLTIVHPFDRTFAAVEAEDFPALLRDYMPQLAALYVGENFRYGKGRKGDVACLIETSRPLGLSVFSIQRIRENGEPISSTRIREELSDGHIERVNALLGHTYRSAGIIEGGRKLGRELGFPTLNMRWEPELLPKFGVYAVRVRRVVDALKKEPWRAAVANFGLRPTVEKDPATHPLLEIHVLDSLDWQPGESIEVLWDGFMRPECVFSGLDELKSQILRDVKEAKIFHQKKNAFL